MAFLRIAEARAASADAIRYKVQTNASAALREEARCVSRGARFDLFLRHSCGDAETILGIKKLIEAFDLSVYVDCVDDSGLDGVVVTSSTAEALRHGSIIRTASSTRIVLMRQARSGCLGNLDTSTGENQRFVWILPLVVSSDHEYTGQEY